MDFLEESYQQNCANLLHLDDFEMSLYCLFALGLALPEYKWGFWLTISTLCILAAIGLMGPFVNVLANFYTSVSLLEFGLGMVVAYLYKPAATYLRTPPASGVLISVGLICIAFIFAFPVFFNVLQLHLLAISLPTAVIVFCALVLEENGHYITLLPVIASSSAVTACAPSDIFFRSFGSQTRRSRLYP
jgi:hypothetical protein